LAEELKYNAPVINELPSLSTDGSEDFAPRYLSSKLSKESAAEVADVAASPALVDAVDALAAASFAFVVAVVDADVAVAASTNKDHLALSVLEVSGCDPEDV
jgi:hypothetical protein